MSLNQYFESSAEQAPLSPEQKRGLIMGYGLDIEAIRKMRSPEL